VLPVCAVVLAVFGVLTLVLVMVPGRPPASGGAGNGSLGHRRERPLTGKVPGRRMAFGHQDRGRHGSLEGCL
jgi:hypothetical protein